MERVSGLRYSSALLLGSTAHDAVAHQATPHTPDPFQAPAHACIPSFHSARLSTARTSYRPASIMAPKALAHSRLCAACAAGSSACAVAATCSSARVGGVRGEVCESSRKRECRAAPRQQGLQATKRCSRPASAHLVGGGQGAAGGGRVAA